MLNVDDDIYAALSNDTQLAPLIPGGVFYAPVEIPLNPTYPLIFYERKQKPAAWADDEIVAYKATVTVHVMSEGGTNAIMSNVERIMTGLGYVFTDSGPGNEPDCYRDYMVFETIKEV